MEIQAKSICFSVGEKRIIDSISLDLKNNEFIGIIGPNGIEMLVQGIKTAVRSSID